MAASRSEHDQRLATTSPIVSVMSQEPLDPGATLSLFRLLRDLELPARDFAVFGSGPLAIRGIIDAPNDLDVLCRGVAWERAKQLGPLIYLPDHDVSVVAIEDGALTFGTRWAIGAFDVDLLIDTAEMIDGLPFVAIEHVIAYKQIAGRPKDLEHLRLLDAYGTSPT